MTYILLALFLTQSPPSGGVITGRVLGMDGKPASGVRVSAIEAVEANGSSVLGGIAESGIDGIFRIQGITPGRYRVAAGFLETPTYHPGVDAVANATVFTVERGSTINANFRLVRSPGVIIRGRVVQPSGQTVVLDQLSVALDNGQLRATARVGADGVFRFERVPPGIYSARIIPTRRPVVSTIQVGNSDVTLAMEAPMLYSGMALVDNGKALSFPPGGPAPQVTLNSTPAGALKSDGTFQFDPERGDFPLTLRIKGLPFGYFVRSITYDGKDLLNDSLTVTDSPAGPVIINLTRTPPAKTAPLARVRGRVTGVPSSLAADVFGVVLTGGPENRGGATRVRPDGTWEFEGVEPGVYGVHAILMPPGGIVVHTPGQSLLVLASGKEGVEIPLLLRLETSGHLRFTGDGASRVTAIPLGMAVEFTRLGDSTAAQAPLAVIARVSSGGAFGPIALVSGEYLVRLSGLPAGSTLKSLSFGTTNLLKDPLKAGAELSNGIPLTVELEPNK